MKKEKNRTKYTPLKKELAFLEALEHCGNVVKSCQISGVSRRAAYDWRGADPEFAKKWEKALDRGTDALEDEAVRRAVDGVDKPVYMGGKFLKIKEYSDTLLIFLLKCRRPEKYRDRQEVVVHGQPSEARDKILSQLSRVSERKPEKEDPERVN